MNRHVPGCAPLWVALATFALLTAAVPARAETSISPAPPNTTVAGEIDLAVVGENSNPFETAPGLAPIDANRAVAAARMPPAPTPPIALAADPAPVVTNPAVANLWDRVRAGFTMPDLEGPLVDTQANWYAARPELVKTIAERSHRYLFHIVQELEKRGMPTELALLPMVESAFNPLAYSRAHASGLWQFIPATGKTYNLPQNWWFDARRDIVASTTAALDYLQTIYEMHGHWHLALASYNWGENAVGRAIERNQRLGRPTDYASLPMPAETRWYVPKLQALKNILMNPAAHGIELEPIANAPYFANVTLTRDIDLRVAAKLAEVPLDEIVALNAGHNRPVVSSAQAATLVLPAASVERFTANFAAREKPLTNWRTYSAQRGERIESIAAAHGITIDRLRKVNSIRGAGRLQESADLLVPTSGGLTEPLPLLGVTPVAISAEMPHAPARRGGAKSGVRLSSPLQASTTSKRGKTATPAAKIVRTAAPAPRKPVAKPLAPKKTRG